MRTLKAMAYTSRAALRLAGAALILVAVWLSGEILLTGTTRYDQPVRDRIMAAGVLLLVVSIVTRGLTDWLIRRLGMTGQIDPGRELLLLDEIDRRGARIEFLEDELARRPGPSPSTRIGEVGGQAPGLEPGPGQACGCGHERRHHFGRPPEVGACMMFYRGLAGSVCPCSTFRPVSGPLAGNPTG